MWVRVCSAGLLEQLSSAREAPKHVSSPRASKLACCVSRSRSLPASLANGAPAARMQSEYDGDRMASLLPDLCDWDSLPHGALPLSSSCGAGEPIGSAAELRARLLAQLQRHHLELRCVRCAPAGEGGGCRALAAALAATGGAAVLLGGYRGGASPGPRPAEGTWEALDHSAVFEAEPAKPSADCSALQLDGRLARHSLASAGSLLHSTTGHSAAAVCDGIFYVFGDPAGRTSAAR
jgi:hypothetical protein